MFCKYCGNTLKMMNGRCQICGHEMECLEGLRKVDIGNNVNDIKESDTVNIEEKIIPTVVNTYNEDYVKNIEYEQKVYEEKIRSLENDKSKLKKKYIRAIILSVIGALIMGWIIGFCISKLCFQDKSKEVSSKKDSIVQDKDKTKEDNSEANTEENAEVGAEKDTEKETEEDTQTDKEKSTDGDNKKFSEVNEGGINTNGN